MIDRDKSTPNILLHMPEPERILEAISSIEKVKEFIECFNKLVDYDDIDEIIKKLDDYITLISSKLSDAPEIVPCYKTEQQRKCDEYFFIQRTHTEVEQRFILNAFVIARDVLVNNKIDNYLEKDKIKLTLEVMAKFLSYTLLRGELNEC